MQQKSTSRLANGIPGEYCGLHFHFVHQMKAYQPKCCVYIFAAYKYHLWQKLAVATSTHLTTYIALLCYLQSVVLTLPSIPNLFTTRSTKNINTQYFLFDNQDGQSILNCNCVSITGMWISLIQSTVTTTIQLQSHYKKPQDRPGYPPQYFIRTFLRNVLNFCMLRHSVGEGLYL